MVPVSVPEILGKSHPWTNASLGVKCKFSSLNFVKEFRRFLGKNRPKIGQKSAKIG